MKLSIKNINILKNINKNLYLLLFFTLSFFVFNANIINAQAQTNDDFLTPKIDTSKTLNHNFTNNTYFSNAGIKAELAATIEKTEVDEKSQAAVFDSKKGITFSDEPSEVRDAFGNIIGCTVGQVLGQILASTVSMLLGKVSNFVTGLVEKLFAVSVVESGQLLADNKANTNANTGTVVSVFGIGGIVLPSWNSIAYCIVNSIIEYIANSTIAWIQGGFEGNPAFVNNPEQFFKDLANREANAFLKEIAYGSIGLNICEPFRAQIVLTIARSHLGSQMGYGGQGGYSTGGFNGKGGALGTFGSYGGCTLDDAKGNLEDFLSGNFGNGGWDSWFKISQIDSNNPYTVYFNLTGQLSGAVNEKHTIAERELSWGNGFLSFRKCDENVEPGKEGECPIKTPGTVIQGQLEKTLGISKDRLVLAEKFDQVIAVLVNKLINTALDKVLEVALE